MNTIKLNNISTLNISNISIDVKEGTNISIVGSNVSGKTTLAKILNNKIKYDGEYIINGVEVVKSNAYVVDRFVSVVKFKDEELYDDESLVDLLFDNLTVKENDKESEVEKIVKHFKIKDILKYKLSELSLEYKYYLIIIINLFKSNTFLVIDDVFCYLNKDMISKIYSYAKKKKITIINITSTLDNIYYSEYAYFLYKGSIAMEGDINSCLKEEKLIKRMGFKLPFMFDLSLQLNYYEVLDSLVLNRDEMINKIWK